ncbi:MAG: hypothetical protein K0R82_2029 [Flavipsychrobacter sp.]|jgi:hypothetical protein|nr:hypothetical protein [Flavipsychrobacter sp.]
MQHPIDLQKIEESHDYISGYDYQLNIVIWNDAIARKYNIPKSKALGQNVLKLFPQVSADDFRIKCLKESIADKKMFFFSALPYVFENRIYSQLILPGREHNNFHVLSVVRDHVANELYLRTDLLNSIISKPSLVSE